MGHLKTFLCLFLFGIYNAQACRPSAVSTYNRFVQSPSVFIGKVLSLRVICLDETDGKIEIQCDESVFSPYPLIEVQVKPLLFIKGKKGATTFRVQGCGYGGWSEKGETLIYSHSSDNGSSAYFVAQEFDEYNATVQETKELNKVLSVAAPPVDL